MTKGRSASLNASRFSRFDVCPAPGTTTIQGTLNAKPGTAYTLDFFTNAACDPSGNGEGARFFGGAGVNTDAGGNVTFSVTVGQPVPSGRVFTATASQSASPRDTSEFSPCFSSGPAVGQVEFSSFNYRFIEDIGDAVITVNRTGGSAASASVDVRSIRTSSAVARPGRNPGPTTRASCSWSRIRARDGSGSTSSTS